ncbi:MAG: hypothetical protein EZS28_028653 [Streblomastix strix]|uniref:Uncharacterized protein n=1 Tax=Streblomastix strix TaxID=222440 RepID=A0A5J4V0E7_9EUKA|nr:MAG: hypothetical protein EZS28_028653 [Streblomastix strix]
MGKEIGLQGTEQAAPNRIIQNGWGSIDQVVDYLEGFCYKLRSSSSLSSFWKNALWSSNCTLDINEDSKPSDNESEKMMEITNLNVSIPQTIAELELINVETIDNKDQELLEQFVLVDCG